MSRGMMITVVAPSMDLEIQIIIVASLMVMGSKSITIIGGIVLELSQNVTMVYPDR